jgi:arabinosaccharide transport system substrate-binding protein
MSFHLGKPVLVMLVLAVVSGATLWLRPERPHADLTVWCFAESHVNSYIGDGTVTGETPAHRFTRLSGKSVDFLLISSRAEDVRLLSMFNSHRVGEAVPDLAEIEISSIGKFFRPPVSEVGFLPLNDFLTQSGWYGRIVERRFAPWSKQGKIFGVPHDLHPTTITYRKDLYSQAGVDLAAATTWPAFRDACRSFQDYWRKQGKNRLSIGLSSTSADSIVIMLLQRHVNLVDDRNRVFINDPKVAETLRFYVDLAAGARRIGADFNPAPGQSYRDVASGEICAMITPDWTAGYMKKYGSDLAGKVAMMPLPRFEPGDARTASWGGTMIGIPRGCKDPQQSWKLIEALYLDHEAIDYRRRTNAILPPIREYWNDEIYQRGDPFFIDNQKVDQLYIELANELPLRYATPFTTVALGLLSDVLNKAVARVDAGEISGLDEDIQLWLNDAAEDLRRRIDFGTFEEAPAIARHVSAAE